MKARIEKVAPPPKPSAQHAVHKLPGKLPIAQPKPAPAQKATAVEEDPAILAYHRARTDRRNALFLKLRQLSPALFARKEAPAPMMVGIFDAIVARLGLDAADRVVLRLVLAEHVACYPYQRALSREGAMRLDLNGNPVDAVTEEQRERAQRAVDKVRAKHVAVKTAAAKLKAKAAKARDGR